ncbi:GNAT family N-acetyltransferase [Mycolicibacterium sp.]|uniref:GNAT family N-acetyltransferase n=1 Tax=Mycolicibacterium sp. TaxID=2320850 RepID=UPI0037C87535
MTDTAQVRRLTEADWRLFCAIRLRALADSLGPRDPQCRQESAFTAAQWRRRLREHAQFAAFLRERPVGLIAAQPESRDTVYLYSLWLDPAARGFGLARLLIDAAVEWARRRSAHTVRLRVATGNTVARGVYESMGFTVSGVETPGSQPELAMVLTVS